MERPFPAYQGDAPYIFVSYSHDDDAVVYPEIQWLNDQGFNIWYDEGINPGSEWHSALADSIDRAALFLYFVTPSSVVSDHCQREVHYAIDHNKQLLAVHLEETELPSGLGLSLSSIQAILRHELAGEEYRLKLLKGTSDHIQRGIAQVGHARVEIRRVGRGAMAAVGAASFVAGVLITAALLRETAPSGPLTRPEPRRFVMDLEPGDPTGVGQSLAITADGNKIIFNGVGDKGRELYLRSLTELDAVPIRGTEAAEGQEGAGSFALSPDNEWVVFNSPYDRTVKKVRLTGGTPITLTSVADSGQRGLDWGPNDQIVITPSTYTGLTKVSARGGKSEPLTKPEPGVDHSDPWFLPDGKSLLYTTGVYGKTGAQQIAILDLATDTSRTLLDGAYPRLTASGHLLFLRDGSIWAAGFDAKLGEVTTEAVPVVEGVARYAVSKEGTLIYWGSDVPLGFGAPESTLVWLDKKGNAEMVKAPADRYTGAALSPDGKQLAVIIASDKGVRDLWVYTFGRGTMTRLTHDDALEFSPVWSPDGSRIAYTSDRGGTLSLYTIAPDGTGAPQQLTQAAQTDFHGASSWSADGKELLFDLCPSQGACDPAVVTMDKDHTVRQLLTTEFNEGGVAISPDGRWIAYGSNESGQDQIFVRPYPNVGAGRWQVSRDGGDAPLWAPDGTAIYFVGRDGMMEVSVDSGTTFVPGTPRSLFNLHDYGASTQGYDLSRDGERFLTTKRTDQDTGRVVLVQNWFDELARLVPTTPTK